MKKVMLVFAPHPDDEILGVGGTIIKRVKEGKDVVICIATASDDTRKQEAIAAAKQMGVKKVEFLDLPDLHLDRIEHEVLNGKVLEIIKKYKPYEVYTPHVDDLHTDHRTLTYAVMVGIRPKYKFAPKWAYTYETLSETGWNYLSPNNCFNPNVYEDITQTIKDKIKALKHHKSQLFLYPSCRSLKAIEALAMYRGTQAEMPYAEAFTVIRGYKK